MLYALYFIRCSKAKAILNQFDFIIIIALFITWLAYSYFLNSFQENIIIFESLFKNKKNLQQRANLFKQLKNFDFIIIFNLKINIFKKFKPEKQQ